MEGLPGPDGRGVLARLSARRWTVGLFVLLALGVLLRLWLMSISIGTNDLKAWWSFSNQIVLHGLAATYRDKLAFNHPPLMGLYGALCHQLHAHVGGRFEIWYKIGPLLGDALTAAILFRIWSRRAGRGLAVATLFALSPVAILVTGFHGNTDPLLAAFVLLAAVLVERRRWFWAGLALGAAINVKVVPVLLIPPLASFCRSRRDLAAFVGALAIAALPFVPVLVLAGPSFLRNVFAYNSVLDRFGVMAFLEPASHLPGLAPIAGAALTGYQENARYLILAGVAAVTAWSFRSRPFSPVEIGLVVLALAVALSPGFGVQYTVWLVPLLFAHRPRWAVVYSILAGVFIGTAYWSHWDGRFPIYARFRTRFDADVVLLGLCTWTFLLWMLWRLTRQGRSRSGPHGSAGEEAA